jgi:outer membrane protein assembly factor BamB
MLSRVRFFLLLAMILLGLPRLGSTQLPGRVELPSRSLLDRYNLERLWLTNAVIDSSRDRVMTLVLDEESVYVQTENGFITALDSRSGTKRWAQLLARIDTPQFPLTSNDQTVLVNAGMSMFAVDKWSGGLNWSMHVPEQVSTSPAIDPEHIFMSTGTGRVYGYDLHMVQKMYTQNRLPESEFRARLWRQKTSKPIRYPPLSHDGQITFASDTNTLYSVNSEDGSLVFQMEMPAAITAQPVRSGNRLFIATADQRLYCLNAQRGTTNWIFVARANIPYAPILIGNYCHISPNDGSLHCVDIETGAVLWVQEGAERVLARTESYLVSQDRLGNVLLLETDNEQGTSRIAARLPMRHFSIRTENELTDRIYMATPSGMVMCLTEKGGKYPTFFRNPDKRPLEPFFADESSTTEQPEPVDDEF